MEMTVGVLDHYNVNGPRPPFNFPGAWLYSASHPLNQIVKMVRKSHGVERTHAI